MPGVLGFPGLSGLQTLGLVFPPSLENRPPQPLFRELSVIRESPGTSVVVFSAPSPLKTLVVVGTSEASRCWVAEAGVGPNLGGCV